MPLASRCIAWWVLVAFTVAVIVYFGANKTPRNALDNLFKKCSENKGKFWIIVFTLRFKSRCVTQHFFSFVKRDQQQRHRCTFTLFMATEFKDS